MNIDFDLEVALRLIISFCIGSAIGLEREYHSKAAGIRTMIMICLGSTIFTAISLSLGSANPDRLAASIVTGVGFLGAGVIFKEGVTVTGITTATTIWICAALGTAVGAGEYFVAIVGSVIILIVLVFLGRVQSMIESWHQTRIYRINHKSDPHRFGKEIRARFADLNLQATILKDYKDEKGYVALYEVSGRKEKLETLNSFLRDESGVTSFIY
jgi:putative Mg2+ transporter-C (MgtC) family protein